MRLWRSGMFLDEASRLAVVGVTTDEIDLLVSEYL